MIKTNRNSQTPQVNFYRDYDHPDYRKANKDNIKEFFQKKGYGEGLTREFRVS